MSLKAKQLLIAVLGLGFLASLVIVQWKEVERRAEESGLRAHVTVPVASKRCVDCHTNVSVGIVDQWHTSTHANKGISCLDCHQAASDEVDAFDHFGDTIATIVTPRDCSRCHKTESAEFAQSHHAKGGNILASLDNRLAEIAEGAREPFNPHSPTPGHDVTMVNGLASAQSGCLQCHGSKVALEATDGTVLTVDDFQPDENGKPTNQAAVKKIRRNDQGQPVLVAATWPNTGIGRINLDGSLGSCSACHSRHDFSPRRARQPENCGKCHLGPDHPQKEIYEESKHGVAYRDLKEHMHLDSKDWVLGKDYTQAPTCATCHMSGNSRNDGKVTHDPGRRISWTNRPPVSLAMDTDENGAVIKETDPEKREELVHESWHVKRNRMKDVCSHCHTSSYVSAFYKQYDDFIVNYNEKFAKPGQQLMKVLKDQGLITPPQFDDEIEWTWFYLWHHEGRRARHGASMMAPDYAHWHGMFEVAERFYVELIPQARELAEKAAESGNADAADAVNAYIEEMLARPEHAWFESELKSLNQAGRDDAAAASAEAAEVTDANQPPTADDGGGDAATPTDPDGDSADDPATSGEEASSQDADGANEE